MTYYKRTKNELPNRGWTSTGGGHRSSNRDCRAVSAAKATKMTMTPIATSCTRYVIENVCWTKYLGFFFTDYLSCVDQFFKFILERINARSGQIPQCAVIKVCTSISDSKFAAPQPGSNSSTTVRSCSFPKSHNTFHRRCLQKPLGVQKYQSFARAGLHGVTRVAHIPTVVLHRKQQFCSKIAHGKRGPTSEQIIDELREESQQIPYFRSLRGRLYATPTDAISSA